MACRVERNELGAIKEVRAANGKPSIQFQKLLAHYNGNMEKAMIGYAMTQTPSFREWFGNSIMVDENGEPAIFYQDMSAVFQISDLRGKDVAEAMNIAQKLTDNMEVPAQLLGQLTLSSNATDISFTREQPVYDSSEMAVQEAILESLTDGLVTTMSAVPVYLNSMVDNAGSNVVRVPTANQFRFVDTQSTYGTVQGQRNLHFMPSMPKDTIPSGSVAKLINLKENLQDIANERYRQVQNELKTKEGGTPEYEALSEEYIELHDYLYGNKYKKIKGIGDEIRDLKKIQGADPVALAPYIEKEMGDGVKPGRIQRLMDGNFKQTEEAREILRFLISIGDVRLESDYNKVFGHPLFERQELEDANGVSILPPEWTAIYEAWGKQAEGLDKKLDVIREKQAAQFVNNNTNVIKMYGTGGLTLEQLKGGKEGLQDINYFDQFFADIGSGYNYKSGVVPQMIKIVTNEVFEKEEVWAKGIADDLNAVLPKVKKKLKDRPGGFRGFELFRQRDKNGLLKSSLIKKTSFEWEDAYTNMLSQFNEMKTDHERGKKSKSSGVRKISSIYGFRDKWLKKNAQIMNPALIPEIYAQALSLGLDPNQFGSSAEGNDHRDELIKLAGNEDYYKKMVEEQINHIKQYQARRKATVKQYLEEEGKAKEDELSNAAKAQIRSYELEYDPFLGAEYSENGPSKSGGVNVYSRYTNNIFLPLRKINGQETGYYDKTFEEHIEQDEDLRAFYDVAMRATKGIWERLDTKTRIGLTETTVFNRKKSYVELFLDGDLRWYQALAPAFRRMIEDIRGVFGVRIQSEETGVRRESTSNEPIKQISKEQLTAHKNALQKAFDVQGLQFLMDFNRIATTKLAKFSQKAAVQLSPGMRGQIMKLAAEATGLTEDQLETYVEMRQRADGTPGEFLRIGKAMQSGVTNAAATESSFDLPSILKNYSALAAQYAGRQKARPMVEVMKNLYYQSLNPDMSPTEKLLKDRKSKKGFMSPGRNRAEAQYEDWERRVLYGESGIRKPYGVVGKDYEMTDQDYRDAVNNTGLNFFRRMVGSASRLSINGKIYSAKDKDMLPTLNRAIESERRQLSVMEAASLGSNQINFSLKEAEDDANRIAAKKAKLKSLETMRAQLGKNFAWSAVVTNMLNYMRFVMLQYNLKASVMNVLVGQASNKILGASGTYFPPEYLREVTSLQLVAGDVMNNTKPWLMPKKAALAMCVAEDYNMLQDNTNELQRSLTGSKFELARNKLSGFYGQKKGEYYNQIPLVVAILKDTEIKGVDSKGNEITSNVWDAMEVEWNAEHRRWEKKLKDEFRSQENIDSWEHGNSTKFTDYKTRATEIIKTFHGDFDPRSGMMAKSTQLGQPAMMFKTWVPRVLMAAYAKEHDSIITGVKGQKGYVRSHTPLTAFLTGLALGSVYLNPVTGLLIGGAAGFIAMSKGRRSAMNPVQEMAYILKLMSRKMLGFGLHPIVKKMMGKKFPTPDREKEFNKMSSNTFNQIDFNNYQTNIQLLFMALTFITGELLTKAFLWDDDDEEDSPRRRAHNLLMNEFMQLLEDSTLALNPASMLRTVTEFSVVSYLNNVIKAATNLQDFLQGEDENLTGSNMGESKFLNAMGKVMIPAMFRDITEGDYLAMGFGSSMQKQFVKSPMDELFWGEEKQAEAEAKRIKLHRKEFLKEKYPEMSDGEFKKFLNKDFGKKRKGEKYVDYLKRLKAREQYQEAQEEAE